MSIDQQFPVPPLRDTSREAVKNTFTTIQRNFEDVYQVAHNHSYRTTAPSSSEGQISDIFLVNLDGVYYLYSKFPSPINWTRVQVTQV